VVQVMVAEVDVIAVAVTAEITGPTAVVVKVALGEVADRLELLAENTSKLYSVPAVKPVIVTECEVTSVLLSVD
jgi:hypothetical protein